MKLDLVLAAAVLAAASSFAVTVHAAEPTQASLMSQVKVPQAKARDIALALVPSGAVQSVELEQEKGALVWSFDISVPTSRNIHEILVDARTGTIVDSAIETPEAQAEEAAADEVEDDND